MVDEDYLNLLHITFARLLVVVDVTMGLPSKISITSSTGSWLQFVDYEGIPFRCRRCFKTGHTIDSCTRLRVKHSMSWWKEVSPQFYMVDKVVGDLSPPQIMGDLSSDKGLDATINMQRAVSGLGCANNGGSLLGGSSTQASCASKKKMEGKAMAEKKLEDGSGSQGDYFAGFREEHNAIQKVDYAGIQNLKLL
ncbi:hypothetical protein SUGI_0148660 [Cryptomeria japonica]|nr:hypothetical protein SUGI_0148660 [Cryptomeria japonica]